MSDRSERMERKTEREELSGYGATRLSLDASPAFLRVVTAFTEQSARSFGLEEGDALALTLASEEIFSYVSGGPSRGAEMRVTCAGKGYCASLGYSFEASEFKIAAFNLTAKASACEGALVEETGLLIASRMVDHFDFSMDHGRVELTLVKDKTYPELLFEGSAPLRPVESFEIREPDVEEIKSFTTLAVRCYESRLVAPDLVYPGKVVDMTASGEYEAAVAVGGGGEVVGGVLWHGEGGKLIEFFGPYVAPGPCRESAARALTERIISANARKAAVGLITRYPTPDLPLSHFEHLGSLTLTREGEGECQVGAYFRLLREDVGATVWCHEDLADFLREYYRRLAFAREIRVAGYAGERIPGHAALSAGFNRIASSVTLRPVWYGADAAETLEAHGETLRREGLCNIFFAMDLGRQWHCNFTPALKESGFVPRFIIPYGGKSDIVIFERAHGGRD